MNLFHFEECIAHRKRVSSFKPDVPQDETLRRLIALAQKTPSTLDLQPTRFFIIKNIDSKNKVIEACWGVEEIRSAPLLIAFGGDRHVHPRHESDSFDLLFSHKPCGFGWIFKAFLSPLFRIFSPMPQLPAVHKRAWLHKEISLSAMSFMIAAETAGLSVLSVELFDEGRVKRALGIPRSFVVPILIGVGYAQSTVSENPLLPINDVVFYR